MPEPSERDEPRDEPNLELPSLSLGFRRKKGNQAARDHADDADNASDSGEPEPDETSPEPPAAKTPVKKAAKKAPARKTAAKKTAPPPPAKKAAPPPPPAKKAAPPPPPAARTGAAAPPPPAPELDEDPWHTEVEATPPQPLHPPLHPEPATSPRESLEPARISGPLFVDEAEPYADEEPELGVPRESRMSSLRRHAAELPDLTLPEVPGPVAAILTGAVCGLVTVLLAWVAARGCEAVRGVGTCGGFGLFALIAILGIELLIGATLLRAWKVEDPTSTSFLGVGLVAVVAMLFFLDSIDSGWMVLVIPLLTALTFLASWWVTATFVEESGD